MKARYFILILLSGLVFSCQKFEPFVAEKTENLSSSKLILKSMLQDRDTQWTVDDLNIPSENAGWKEITDVSELAFLLEFGSTAGEKYRLAADINVAESELAEKFTSEIGVERFENFEFDGNGKTISGLDLPWAAGVFSVVKNSKIYDLTIDDSKVGAETNVSNFNGTGMLIGSATGTLQVSNINILSCEVLAPCKVGGLVGSLLDVDATFSGCNITDSDVSTVYFKGVSGWAGGFVGFVGREVEKSRASVVKVVATDCSVSGGSVNAHMESSTRFSGKFVGTVNGYDYRENISLTRCTVNTSFNGLDAEAQAFTPVYAGEFLGGDKYGNATVSVDGVDLCLPWDGTSQREPQLSEAAYDGEAGAYLVCHPEELAYFQGKTVTDKKILIRHDIDLNGKTFTPVVEFIYLDGQKVDGTNCAIRNLKVNFKHTSSGYGGALINRVNTTGTIHKNLNFVGADIYVSHYDTVPADIAKAGQYGNAYAATLCSRVWADKVYTVSNVHCYDGMINGVCKIGGILGGSLTMENCSVNNYYIKNHQVNCPNAYKIEKDASIATATCYAEFYTEGECGGLIGFIASNSTITNCAVQNTRMKCMGQQDQNATIEVKTFLGTTSTLKYLIPGRHVNQFIGDIRTQSENKDARITVNVVDPRVSGNKYIGSGNMYENKTDEVEISADSDQATTLDYNYTYSNTSCKYVGSAYYIGCDIVSMHEGDYQGYLYVTENGAKTSVTVDGGLK